MSFIVLIALSKCCYYIRYYFGFNQFVILNSCIGTLDTIIIISIFAIRPIGIMYSNLLVIHVL